MNACETGDGYYINLLINGDNSSKKLNNKIIEIKDLDIKFYVKTHI